MSLKAGIPSSQEAWRLNPTARHVDERLFSLDLLRGLAIGLVLVRHMPDSRLAAPGIFETSLLAIQTMGWVGVDLFFVLSGFLVSGSLFREFDRTGRIDVRRFWTRRGLRIAPPYFAAFGTMAALWCARALWDGDCGRALQVLWDGFPNALFLLNYVSRESWPHSWAVAVEVHFYFAAPLLLLACAWWGQRKIRDAPPFRLLPYACGMVIMGTLAWRVVLSHGGCSWHLLYFRSHLRADTLFLGVLLGYVWWYRRGLALHWMRWSPLLLATVPALLAVPVLFPLETSRLTSTLGFTAIAGAFGGLVLYGACHPELGTSGPKAFLALIRGCAALGRHSYSIYLAHSVLFAIPGMDYLRRQTLRMLDPHFASGFVVWSDRAFYLLGSIVGGVLLWHLVERPAQRWRPREVPAAEPATLCR